MKDFGFREFINGEVTGYNFNELEIANLYFQGHMKVREISQRTSCSIGEIYRILHRHGQPNRCRKDQGTVISLADSGLPVRSIADIMGYTPRHVRNIIKKS
jgi:transposase-like protein